MDVTYTLRNIAVLACAGVVGGGLSWSDKPRP